MPVSDDGAPPFDTALAVRHLSEVDAVLGRHIALWARFLSA
jgi:hypothetical protein